MGICPALITGNQKCPKSAGTELASHANIRYGPTWSTLDRNPVSVDRREEPFPAYGAFAEPSVKLTLLLAGREEKTD
jgi:hypothetical protein